MLFLLYKKRVLPPTEGPWVGKPIAELQVEKTFYKNV